MVSGAMAVILEDKQGLLSGLKYSKTLSDCDNKGEDDCDFVNTCMIMIDCWCQ